MLNDELYMARIKKRTSASSVAEKKAEKNLAKELFFSEKSGKKTCMKIHVMQIKNHKILIPIDVVHIKKKGEKSCSSCFRLCVPILKIYFIQVLLKAVFIQEVLSLMNDWGFSLLPTSLTTVSFFTHNEHQRV